MQFYVDNLEKKASQHSSKKTMKYLTVWLLEYSKLNFIRWGQKCLKVKL